MWVGSAKKPRKSEPQIKIGICSVGYKGESLKSYSPVIICPHRFNDEVVFTTISDIYLKDWENIEWVSEVGMGAAGSVDYVAVCRDDDGEIQDFLCVEIQAAGTTGTPWGAVVDLREGGRYRSDSYNYGINWANEFLKTMMQQVYKKGRLVKKWNRKIVFVLQDVAIDYIQHTVGDKHLHPLDSDNTDEIHFVSFKMMRKADQHRWFLSHSETLTTNIDGVIQLLSGAQPSKLPSEADFVKSILNKGKKDRVF